MTASDLRSLVVPFLLMVATIVLTVLSVVGSVQWFIPVIVAVIGMKLIQRGD